MITSEIAQAFSEQSQSWYLLPVNVHEIDFGGVMSMDPSFQAVAANFGRTLKKNHKRLASIQVPVLIAEQIRSKGLNDAFGLPSNSRPATPPPPAAPGKIDVRLINPFLSSVQDVFEIQAHTKLTPQKPFLRTDDMKFEFGIIGLIALSCQSFRGTIALCFTKEVFLKIYERMLGEVHTEITQEIEDAVAELLNIVYGTAKTQLNKEQGYDFQPAIPTVLRGEHIQLRAKAKTPVVILPFASEVGQVHVEIATEPISPSEKRGP
jgi:chemotaxis protein CheX